MRKKINLFASFSLIGVLAFSLAPSVSAEESTPTVPETTNGTQLARLVDGQWEAVDAAPLDLHNAPAPEGEMSPQLISFDQWFRCFSLNESSEVFSTYEFPKDGVGYPITLQCGNDVYGYKHIRAGKETQWQQKIDAGLAAGWNPDMQAVESWDDLMNMATASFVSDPGEGLKYSAVSQKYCTNGIMGFVNAQFEPVYQFRVTVSWSENNARIITSYPDPRTYCNAN
ncbi:hypothetical protein [Pseudoclavibacter terrae]|uniref:Uncharacterized protein n=1 Tax=Pseudoclavibacter terrae TaxID=1530195 RepID=A0A7J5AXS6_9MICO|nr:hypothetical protein [Pseudoclavibacter terrae]KAB1636240.1 hypothetical protein F8O03_17105 [Pseudoclavibacter terrae]